MPVGMGARQPATPREASVIGAIAAAAGLYFMLVGLGVLPVPGGPRNLHAPLWVALVAGLVFFLGGVAVLLQVLGRANEQGALPADAPHWMRIVQYLIGVTIFASFALIGGWVAWFGEARYFAVPRLAQCRDWARRLRARRAYLLSRRHRGGRIGWAQAVRPRKGPVTGCRQNSRFGGNSAAATARLLLVEPIR